MDKPSSILILLFQGYKIDLGSKQLTIDFVNQSVLQMSLEESVGKPTERMDFSEKLGHLNKQWQLVSSDINEKLKVLESMHEKWDMYEKSLKQLQDWFRDQEDKLRKYRLIGHEISVKQTLRDCRVNMHSLLQFLGYKVFVVVEDNNSIKLFVYILM